jgi:hypothetical protein
VPVASLRPMPFLPSHFAPFQIRDASQSCQCSDNSPTGFWVLSDISSYALMKIPDQMHRVSTILRQGCVDSDDQFEGLEDGPCESSMPVAVVGGRENI